MISELKHMMVGIVGAGIQDKVTPKLIYLFTPTRVAQPHSDQCKMALRMACPKEALHLALMSRV